MLVKLKQLTVLIIVLTLIVPISGQASPTGLKKTEFPNKESENHKTSTEEPNTYLPLVSNALYLPPIIPDTTNVLPPTTTQYLSSISSTGIFTFTQTTPELNAIAPGEIIVAEPTGAASNGFLRKVKTLSTIGESIILETESAVIEDAIQQGSIQISRVLTPDDVTQSDLVNGVSTKEIQQGIEQQSFSLEINDVVLYDEDGDFQTTQDQITANGTLTFEPGFDFSMVVRDWNIEQLNFVMHNQETAELEIQAKVELASIEKEEPLAQYYFTPIIVMVGIVPIVLTPVLTVNVGLDGSVHVGVTAGLTQEFSVYGGLRCFNGVWSPVAASTKEFLFNPPQLSAGLDLKGYVGTRLAMLLYGLVGPYADVNVFLKLEADVFISPWWSLYGGLEMPVGVRFEVLSHKIADYEFVVLSYKILLLHADYTVLFSDDFNDGNADGWITDGLGTWYVENGEYVVDMGSGVNLKGEALAGDLNWTDYIYEVDVKADQGVDKGIIFHCTETCSYGVDIVSAPYNVVHLGNNGVNLVTVAFPNSSGVWYHVKIELVGANIKVYVDDQLLIDYTGVITHGRIGVAGWTGAVGLDIVRFDNLMITSIP